MRCFITVLLFLLGMPLSHAQENLFYEFGDTPLKKVIQQLESETGTSFSYAEDLVGDKNITALVEGLTLDEVLGILEAQSGLRFEKIKGRPQVIIVPVSQENGISIYLLDHDTRLPISEEQVVVDSSLTMESDKRGRIQLKDIGRPEYRLEATGYHPALI